MGRLRPAGAPLLRGHDANLHDHRCARALKRICNVCRHFEGDDPHAPGRCGIYGDRVTGATHALDCDNWERRWAHEVAS